MTGHAAILQAEFAAHRAAERAAVEVAAAAEADRRRELNRWCLAFSRALSGGNRSVMKRALARIVELS